MKPDKEENKALYNSDMNLWNQCDVVNLITNFRVGESPWCDALNRIRYGETNDQDYELMKSRYTTNLTDQDNRDKALHAHFTNKAVNEHNKEMLKKVKKPLMTIIAERPRKKKTPATEKGTIDNTSYLEKLELKEGARVVLVNNIDLPDGLVNGAPGKVLNFVYRKLRGETEIIAVIVEFEDPEIGRQCRKDNINIHDDVKNKNGVPVFKDFFYYKSKGRGSSKRGGKDLWLKQVPLTLNYASTAHKLQGKTITTDIVVYGSNNLINGCGYVMLSRAKNINQIYLDPSFIPEKHLKPHKASLIEARKLEERCIAKIQKEEKFDIFYVNMRAKNNFEDVTFDPFANQSTLVCLVQTCLEGSERFQWKGRHCMEPASYGNGKGVCCLISDKENTINEKTCVTEKFQIMTFTWKFLQIFVIYISSGANKEVLKEISESIQTLLTPVMETIVLGDFNFHPNIENRLSQYLQYKLGLIQIVNEPTFALGKNTIDHIYVPRCLEENIKVLYRFNYYTDHLSFNLLIK